MDFYWKRQGWRWVVASVARDGDRWVNETILFTSWREKTAAFVCGLLFQTYLEGQDVARRRLAVTNGERQS